MGLFSKKPAPESDPVRPCVNAHLTECGVRLKYDDYFQSSELFRHHRVDAAEAFEALIGHLGLELEADRRAVEGHTGSPSWGYVLKFVDAPKEEAPDA